MKGRILATALTLCIAALCGVGAAGDGERVDWYLVQNRVVEMLVVERRDIVEAAGEVTANEPVNAEEAMIKFSIMMRVGIDGRAMEAVGQLGRMRPELDGYNVSGMYYAACDTYGNCKVARRIVEVFAETTLDLSLGNRLIRMWNEAGGTFEEIDGWLAEMPAGRNGYWVKERLAFNERNGRGQEFRRRLEQEVRANPGDVEAAVVFLDALDYAGANRDDLELGWMPVVIETGTAPEAERLGGRLKSLEQWAEAAAFFERAVDMELTDEQVSEYSSNFQMMMSAENARAMFAVGVREALAECLVKLGRADEAQKRMVEAADIRDEHELPMNARLAGTVQQASGQRVIEGRIREQQEFSQDDPQYWRNRAQYYRGRGEAELEEEALVRGLSLTVPKERPERPGKGFVDMRSWLLRDYAMFLKRVGREAGAVALLREEIADSPADSVSAERAAALLGSEFSGHLDVGDEVLWRWLGDRDKWEFIEERLLWRMLELAKAEDVEKYLSRAEKLAGGGDASRAYVLGWIENRMRFAERSIALLQRAVEQAGTDEVRQRAAFALFESYLDTGDWKNAEAIFPQARKRLTAREIGDWNSRIALVAARAGAKEDAMRIWQLSANEDPARALQVERLAKEGLAEEVRAWYRRLQTRLPEAEAPARVLEMLGE